ncbi:DUF262 domain-containing protein [Hyalangium rubrum]|uniref:DUF262 domain-containing protein n=1 Tax=Hyalangium rubrum TaxID=3103134 RepID=A0ABU5H6C6_9BACT|nr:DUF262 domain-containing protein [Hyalangium sp. s54d21]MDY7229026.1 DUF262 domain-containing protein [Hyalangium sp. s54d21]
MQQLRLISEQEKQEAEEQIVEKQRDVDYDTKEYPVETVVQKYLEGKDEDENEIFIPDYQRDFAWDVKRQSKFIESVLIGLPIPYVFVADAHENPGRLEIVDGSQRIRTLAAFLSGDLVLSEMEKLNKLNGFRYQDLPLSRQRRFNRRTIRMIELTEMADEEVRRDIFERINTGSEELNDMEKRRGILEGPLTDFLSECAQEPLLARLAPLPQAAIRRREREEFILRFFAYLNNYTAFKHNVNDFLNDYLKTNQGTFDRATMKAEFVRMLEFVARYLPNGFKKARGHTRTPRIRFEAIAVGVALALRQIADLVPQSVTWVESDEFRELTTSDASNSRVKVVKRIEYVRNNLLAGSSG